MNCLQIIGPPGTGKTQTLMGMLEELLVSIPANEILYSSFTKVAVLEAVARVEARFGLQHHDLPYFNTLHSICYRHLGLAKTQVVNPRKKRDFCKLHGLKLSEVQYESSIDEPWEQLDGTQDGDVFFAWVSWAQSLMLTWEEAASRYTVPDFVPLGPREMVKLAHEYHWWKQELGLYDFGQMLLECLESDWVPPVQIVIVDESQDLSPLQQALVMKWGAEKRIVLANDPNQCIYNFQGADPTWLLELPGERQFLEVSHRVPAEISKFAQNLIGRNRKRYDKVWRSTQEQGELHWDVEFERLVPEIAKSDETWFLLARNNAYLHKFAELLKDAGIPYANLRGTSPLKKIVKPVLAALKLAGRERIPGWELKLLVKDIPATPWFVRGAKAHLAETVKNNPGRQYSYYDLAIIGAQPELILMLRDPETCLGPLGLDKGFKDYFAKIYQERGIEGLTQKPKVTLSSIHGVKGGEADNVVLLPNTTRRTEESELDDPEAERRVWYVGITRARKRLYILEPTQKRFYGEL